MNRWYKILLPLTVLVLIQNNLLKAYDNAHFYRANFFWGEPRLEKPWLSSIDIYLSGGSTLESRNCNGDETCLLNIYGLHNMHHLGDKVPDLDPANPLDAILIALNQVPDRPCFGMLKYSGEFVIHEGVFDIRQNFDRGFFSQLYLPVRALHIKQVNFADVSPQDSTSPNMSTPEWQNFLHSFDAILERYKLCAGNTQSRGFGDLTILAGWTKNYQNTSYLDFVDATIKIGVLCPTGKRKNEHCAFDLPTGYNHHWGVSLNFDASIGLWEWLTVGLNSGLLIFVRDTQSVRMQTSLQQNGFIKLAQGCAVVRPGILGHFGCFLKADHFNEMISIILGYSYDHQARTKVCPIKSELFPITVVNHDEMFKSWTMHVINLIAEIDFANKEKRYHPRLSFYLNIPVSGKRIFKTTVGGINTGIDLTWQH